MAQSCHTTQVYMRLASHDTKLEMPMVVGSETNYTFFPPLQLFSFPIHPSFLFLNLHYFLSYISHRWLLSHLCHRCLWRCILPYAIPSLIYLPPFDPSAASWDHLRLATSSCLFFFPFPNLSFVFPVSTCLCFSFFLPISSLIVAISEHYTNFQFLRLHVVQRTGNCDAWWHES